MINYIFYFYNEAVFISRLAILGILFFNILLITINIKNYYKAIHLYSSRLFVFQTFWKQNFKANKIMK